MRRMREAVAAVAGRRLRRLGAAWAWLLVLAAGGIAALYALHVEFVAARERIHVLHEALAVNAVLVAFADEADRSEADVRKASREPPPASRRLREELPRHLGQLRQFLQDEPEFRAVLDPLDPGARGDLQEQFDPLVPTIDPPSRRDVPAAPTFVPFSTSWSPALRETLVPLDARLRSALAAEQGRLQSAFDRRSLVLAAALVLVMAASLAIGALRRRDRLARRRREILRERVLRLWRETRAHGRWLASLRREVLAPLDAIHDFAGLLHQRLDDPLHRRHVDAIAQSADAVSALLGDAYALATVGTVRPERQAAPTRLHDLVEVVRAGFAQLAAEKGLLLRSEFAPDIPDGLRMDAGRLRRLLVHLVVNAIKHTRRGEIVLRAAVADDPAVDGAVTAVLEVEDSGAGISFKDLARVFEPAISLELAAARQLARRMGGDLSVRSERWKGACFRITLPGLPLAAPAERERVDPVRLRLLPPCTVLVVDDSPLDRQLLAAMIAGTPHRLLSAARILDASRLVRRTRPDLMLIDLRLLDLQSARGLRTLRAGPVLRDTRVLAAVASGAGGEEICLSGLFDGYVGYPLTEEALCAELRCAVAAQQRTGSRERGGLGADDPVFSRRNTVAL